MKDYYFVVLLIYYMLTIILFELTTTNTQNDNFLVPFYGFVARLVGIFYIISFNSLFVHVVNSIYDVNYQLYIMILHQFETIRGDSIFR